MMFISPLIMFVGWIGFLVSFGTIIYGVISIKKGK
jgi:hypothetical protein